MTTTVAIVEDNPEFLQHFASLIEAESDCSVCGLAATGSDAIRMIDAGRADLYLVDLGLPDMSGIDVIRHALRKYPDSEVMVISVFGDEQHIIESIEAGATGYVLKDCSPREIAQSIRTLREGGSALSPAVARKVLQRFRETSRQAPLPAAPASAEAGTHAAMTEREVQILTDLSRGMSYKEIGELRSISAQTVAHHVKNIYRKLAVHSRGEAVYEASKRGLVAF